MNPLPAALVLLGTLASAGAARPEIAIRSESAVRITDARVTPAGGGSRVAVSLEPSLGYWVPGKREVRITIYDFEGNPFAEKTVRIDASRLRRSHLAPRPRLSCTASFPIAPSRIARVAVVEGRSSRPENRAQYK